MSSDALPGSSGSNSSASSSASTTSLASSRASAILSARFASVHVAGTNGKGSVTAMVDAALRAAGHRTARYTSPHLVDLTERFVIDGRPVDREGSLPSLPTSATVVDRLRDDGDSNAQPTFFEVTTAVAFELFRRARSRSRSARSASAGGLMRPT